MSQGLILVSHVFCCMVFYDEMLLTNEEEYDKDEKLEGLVMMKWSGRKVYERKIAIDDGRSPAIERTWCPKGKEGSLSRKEKIKRTDEEHLIRMDRKMYEMCDDCKNEDPNNERS